MVSTSNSPRVAILHKGGEIVSWSADLAEGFQQAGAACHRFPLRSNRFAERKIQFLEKKRLFFNDAVLHRIARDLRKFSPDLVVVLNYPGFPLQAEAAIRGSLRTNVPIVGWLCDRIERLPDGFAPAFNGVYYFDSACKQPLRTSYKNSNARIDFLPLAVNPRRYSGKILSADRRKPSLMFAGNCPPDRKAIFDEYKNLGGKLDVYGPQSGGRMNFWRNRKLSSDALKNLYQSYLVSFNLLQSKNTQAGLNLRAFEIPCAGGLGSYPDVEDLHRCFVPNEEIIVYQDLSDLKETIEELIKDPAKADAMTLAGNQRVMREHTFFHRAKRILSDWL